MISRMGQIYVVRIRALVVVATALVLVGGCERRNQHEAAMPQEPIAAGREGVSAWHWQLDYHNFNDSQLSVYRDQRRIAQYQLDCNLEPSDPESESEDGEGARVDVVYPAGHRAGLLVVACPVGAHSVQLALFDPLINRDSALFYKVGSFFADWELRGDQLWVLYDQPCTRPDETSCEIPFETIELPWQ